MSESSLWPYILFIMVVIIAVAFILALIALWSIDESRFEKLPPAQLGPSGDELPNANAALNHYLSSGRLPFAGLGVAEMASK